VSQVAKYIGGQAPSRRDPTLQSFAADGQQRDLLAQHCERCGRDCRLRSDGRRLDLRRLDRPGREANRKPIRCGVGLARKLAALLYGIEPLNDLVKAREAIANEASRDGTIALANRRQDILGGVHRASHRREVDDAGAPFQRVERAERPIQTRAVTRLAF
jgi:hypothetical protein